MIDVLLVGLIVLPIPALAATVFFWRLWRRARPSTLGFMLALLATIAFVCGTWLAGATFSSRFLGTPFPIAFLPVTILAIELPLISICVIAFVLWRSR